MIFKTDFLIIGNGIAGSLLALEIASHGQVILLCKDDPQEGNNTYYAQGGIAAVLPGNDDTAEKHMADTLMAGDGLCDKNAVSQMVQSAPQIIETLLKYGVVFEKSNCHFKLGREGAHSEKRILFYKDMTGKEIQSKLLSRVKAHPNILFLPYHFAIDLLMERKMSSTPSEGKRCWGAYVYNKRIMKSLPSEPRKHFWLREEQGRSIFILPTLIPQPETALPWPTVPGP